MCFAERLCFTITAGTGVSLMPANPNISWWNPTLWLNDPLYKEITGLGNADASGLQFFLGHHTFTHENMNNVTYNDAFQQIRLNQVRFPLPAASSSLLEVKIKAGRHPKHCAMQHAQVQGLICTHALAAPHLPLSAVAHLQRLTPG